jgi:hypothetical protein
VALDTHDLSTSSGNCGEEYNSLNTARLDIWKGVVRLASTVKAIGLAMLRILMCYSANTALEANSQLCHRKTSNTPSGGIFSLALLYVSASDVEHLGPNAYKRAISYVVTIPLPRALLSFLHL